MSIRKISAICLAAVLASLFAMPAAAQVNSGKHSASLLYGAASTASNGFTDKAGFVNFSAEYGFRLTSKFTVGFSAGYGYDRDKGHANLQYDGDLVSGFSDRRMTVVPMLAQLGFFPLESSRLQPYIMVGAGIQYAKFDIVGDQIDKRTKSSWAAVYSPQIGARFFPVADRGFYLDARFSWNYAGNKWEIMEIKSIRRIGISVGAGITF